MYCRDKESDVYESEVSSPTLGTLDLAFYISSIQKLFIHFNLYLNPAYAAHGSEPARERRSDLLR